MEAARSVLDKSESREVEKMRLVYTVYRECDTQSVCITMLHMHVRKKQKEERSASTLSLIKSNQINFKNEIA